MPMISVRQSLAIVIGLGLSLPSFHSFANESSTGVEISSAEDGNWSSPSSWQDGVVPGPDDAVAISHSITYDLDQSRISGLTILDAGMLVFASNKSATLETDENLVNFGELEMRPASPEIVHRLRFVDVDETKFVGDGMEILDTDVGLWTAENGILDAVGAAKTAWTRLTGGAKGGDGQLTVRNAEGWQVGDRIAIVPTEHPSVGKRAWNGFEERTISAVDGETIDLDSPLDHDHPEIRNPFNDDVYTAEVLNLTRNVKIEGAGNNTPSFQPEQNGRAHVMFLATNQPQTLKYIELNHLGPRKADRKFTEGVKGRYPLHFHRAGDGSRGSLIEGLVAQRSGNRGFVPHASHGITLRSTIAYDVFETPYWWDHPVKKRGDEELENENNTDDLLIDHAVAARIKADVRGYRLAGYLLGRGAQNSLAIKNSVAVGVQGNKASSGFQWPSFSKAVWDFGNDNIAHNNKVFGVFAWQNNKNRHKITNFVAFHNNVGISHGAYGNNFQYRDLYLFDNNEADFISHASSSGHLFREDGYLQAIERMRTTGTFVIRGHKGRYVVPTLVKDSVIEHIEIDEGKKKVPGLYDFVNVTTVDGTSIEPSNFTLVSPKPYSIYRVQRPDGTAFQISGTNEVTQINPFYDSGKAADDSTTPANQSTIRGN